MKDLTLWRPIDGVRKRVSSYDRSGGNDDRWFFEAGETKDLFSHAGESGVVLRLWFTLNTEDPLYLRNTTVSMQFDGESTLVEIPIGMLTGTGIWAVNDINSPSVSVMRARPMNKDQQGVGSGSFSMTWQMPFSRDCKIQIHNRSEKKLMLFFYVDYLLSAATDLNPFLFHATHHHQFTKPFLRDSEEASSTTDLHQSEALNLSCEHNYLWAAIDGYEGNYVGTVLAVESHPDRCGKWYEGDDMFFIDGSSWPPSLHGTGTEDYFGMAWGIHRPYQGWDHGVSHYERNITDHDRFYDGRCVLYRWHLADPIPFRKSLHASIEAGHANDCEQDYESVAFWYGRRLE